MNLDQHDFFPALIVALGGSFHCVGMCGGFALAAGVGNSPGTHGWTALWRQLLYHGGKTTTYLFLGALAGLGGQTALQAGDVWFRLLTTLAGIVLLLMGLHSLGWLPGMGRWMRWRGFSLLLGYWSMVGRRLFELRSSLRPLFIGSFSGFLPCPLVYAFLAAAAATGSVPGALLVMAALGLGTVPILAAVGLGGATFSPLVRGRLVRLTGALLVILAFYTWYRGWTPPCCHGGV